MVQVQAAGNPDERETLGLPAIDRACRDRTSARCHFAFADELVTCVRQIRFSREILRVHADSMSTNICCGPSGPALRKDRDSVTPTGLPGASEIVRGRLRHPALANRRSTNPPRTA